MKSQNSNVTLPIKFPPPSLVYGHIITPLSIISGHEGTEEWIYSNYIQLCAPAKVWKYGEEDVEFLNFYPKYFSDFESFYLRTYNLNEEILKIEEDQLVSHLINWINHGYYIQTFLEESQIQGTALCKKKIVRLNEQMIYGYDLEKKVFKMTVFDERNQFAQIEITFEDIVHIFFSDITKELCKKSEWISVGNEYGLMLYKFREDVKYTFNLQSIIEQLDEYVYSKNSAIHFTWLSQEKLEFVFGMQVYESLIKWIDLHESEYLDNRSLFGLWDHKKIMKDRLEFLTNAGYLDVKKEYSLRYQEIVDIANNLRLLIMKYNIVREKSVLSFIIERLKIMAQKEYEILEEVLRELKIYKNI